TGDFVRAAIHCGALTAVHDVSDSSVAVTVAEMALASGIGAIIDAPISDTVAGALFAEDQGLYVVTARDAALMDVLMHAESEGIMVERLGRTIASRIIFELRTSDHAVSLDDLRAAHEDFFPTLMAGEV